MYMLQIRILDRRQGILIPTIITMKFDKFSKAVEEFERYRNLFIKKGYPCQACDCGKRFYCYLPSSWKVLTLIVLEILPAKRKR